MGAIDDIEDYKIKKTKRYDVKWNVVGDELFVGGESAGKIDMNNSRYLFKNRKLGQLFFARVSKELYHVFRECNREGYVEPKHIDWGIVEEDSDDE